MENPWTLLPDAKAFKPISFDMSKTEHVPNLVIARAPPTTLWKDIKQVAACLGSINSFKLSSLTNTFEQVVEITYVHEESALLAEGFQLGCVQLATTESQIQKRDALMHMDETVAEEDRLLAAAISAGTAYGSILALKEIREGEDLLEGEGRQTSTEKVEDWLNEESTPATAGETPDAKGIRPNTQSAQSPTMDVLEKYKHGKPTDYRPSPKAVAYLEKLNSMTLVDAPEGLHFETEFIDEEEEADLLRLSMDLPWDQEVPTRQTIQYGFHYEYQSKGIKEGRKWPKHLDGLRQKLFEAGVFPEYPTQCIVNKITPPHGFGAHIDSESHFAETIAIIGTGSGVNFVLWNKQGTQYHIVRSQRRSLIVLKGAARYEWYHSIPEGVDDLWKNKVTARGIRISYTLRMMQKQYESEPQD